MFFAKPDQLCLETVKIPKTNFDWSIPNYGFNGGINDRFVICNGLNSAKIFSGKIKRIENFCKDLQSPLHPERFLLYCAVINRLKVHLNNFKFQRARLNGIKNKENFRSRSKLRLTINKFRILLKIRN